MTHHSPPYGGSVGQYPQREKWVKLMHDLFQSSWCKKCGAATWFGYLRSAIPMEVDGMALNYFQEAKAIEEGCMTFLCQPQSNGQFWASSRDAYGVNWWHKRVINKSAGAFIILAQHKCQSQRAMAVHEDFFGKSQLPTGDGDEGRIPF